MGHLCHLSCIIIYLDSALVIESLLDPLANKVGHARFPGNVRMPELRPVRWRQTGPLWFLSHFHENVTQQLFYSHISWMMHLHTFQISPHSDKIVMKMWSNVWVYFVLVTFSSQFHHIFTEMSLAKITVCLHFCLFVMKMWWKWDVRKKIKCILKSIFSKFSHYSFLIGILATLQNDSTAFGYPAGLFLFRGSILWLV